MLFDFKDVRDHANYYYVSCYGSAFACFVILCIMINMIYHYVDIFHRSNDRAPQNKTNYILFFIVCIIGLFVCCQYAFTRTNLLTFQSISNITNWQCSIGFYGSFSSIVTFQIFIYIILIYRIQITFARSIYEYSKIVYIVLNIGLIPILFTCLSSLPLQFNDTYFVLEYFTNNQQEIYCAATADPGSKKFFYDTISISTFIIAQVIYDTILLYMFTKRLYTLQSQLVAQHLAESRKYQVSTPSHSDPEPPKTIRKTSSPSNSHENMLKIGGGQKNPKISQRPSTPFPITEDAVADNDDLNQLDIPSPSMEALSVEMETVNNDNMDKSIPSSNPEPKMKRTLTVEDIQEEMKGSKNNYAAKRILTLHELIKQHTILLFFIVSSGIIWYILLIFVNSDQMWNEIWLHVMITIICLWLMFASSNKYWKFMTNYGCCSICYCNKKRDINARTCFFFC